MHSKSSISTSITAIRFGVYVVLDHHLRQAGAGADGSPIDGSYTLQNWKDSWAVMANRYANHPAVVGADLHNEPYTLSWATWAGYVESCANYLLTLAPLWLYFVEGVGTNSDSTSYWWGGALKDAGGRPIVLTVPEKVVYSPHEYGQSVGTQPWLETDDTTVSGYPNNLYAVWRANWGTSSRQRWHRSGSVIRWQIRYGWLGQS